MTASPFRFILWLSCLISLEVCAQEKAVIGNQTWMKKNLGATRFRNGDAIPQISSDAEWQAASSSRSPAWCYYKNDPATESKYGKLYNWYAVADNRGICPAGWEVPGKSEWARLADFMFYNARGSRRSVDWWSDTPQAADVGSFKDGSNAGRMQSGLYLSPGKHGGWWSSYSDAGDDKGWFFVLSGAEEHEDLIAYHKGSGFAVRCIQERIAEPEGKVDAKKLYDGKVGGGGGSGNGSGLDLAGWKWEREPRPKLSDQEKSGKVVFEITIDADGTIVGLKVIERSISIEAARICEEEIQRLNFIQVSDRVPEFSKGKITIYVSAQLPSAPANSLVPEETEDPDLILSVVEETATPKGGMAAFYKYVGSSLRYPPQATRSGVEGKVYVSFVINRDGTITDARVERGIGAGCDEEAVRIVMFSPPWNPGKQRGKPVRQKYTLPIQFKLQ